MIFIVIKTAWKNGKNIFELLVLIREYFVGGLVSQNKGDTIWPWNEFNSKFILKSLKHGLKYKVKYKKFSDTKPKN